MPLEGETFTAIIAIFPCFLVLLIGSINPSLKTLNIFITVPSKLICRGSAFQQNWVISHNFKNAQASVKSLLADGNEMGVA